MARISITYTLVWQIKEYWMSRLTYCYSKGFNPCKRKLCGTNAESCLNVFSDAYNEIQFRNGYSKDAPIITVECLGVEVKEGKPEWGAEAGVKYFVIKLGDIINTTK